MDRRFSALQKSQRRDSRKLKNATVDDFEFLRVIGMGSCGKVYLVEHKQSLKHLAIKTLSKRLVYDRDQDESVRMEREIMTTLDHPLFVKIKYAFQDK